MRYWFVAGLCFLATHAYSHEYFAGNFRLIHPWSEASNPNVSEANVYCIFDDVQQEDKLLGAMSSIAESVEIRKSSPLEPNSVKLQSFDIPANVVSQMSMGTVYLTLVGLRAPLQWGRSYPMQMKFERAGVVNVMVSIGAH